MKNPRSRRELNGLSNFYHVKLGIKQFIVIPIIGKPHSSVPPGASLKIKAIITSRRRKVKFYEKAKGRLRVGPSFKIFRNVG